MKRLKCVLAVAAMVSSAMVSAQTIGGIMLGGSDFQSTDILNDSRGDASFTTARVSAMGGAFTSLGGDVASININPAGLGMFRSSVLSFSPSVTSSSTSNIFNTSGTDKGRFSINNLGVVLNLHESSQMPVSVTFGFSYNKLADFNYRSSFALGQSTYSIADLFANQMYGIKQSALKSTADPFNNYDIYVNEWGGVLAYQSLLIDPVDSNPDTYMYEVNSIGSLADVYSSLDVVSKGSAGEYSLACGVNVNNVLYLGANIGLRELHSTQSIYYVEEYYTNGVASNDYLDRMSYSTHIKSSGAGVNITLGAIYRPMEGLRMGFSFRTPSYMSLDRKYYATMGTMFLDETTMSYKSTLIDGYTYNYATAPKLSLGISYTFGNYAALSFDYDRVWYNGMRLQDTAGKYIQSMKEVIVNQYQGANNLRVGAEVKPLPTLAFRVGYAYFGSPLQNDNMVFDKSVMTTKENVTSGIGFKFGRTSLDFAYVMSEMKFTEYDTFYYAGRNNNNDEVTISGNPVENVKRKRNTFTATISLPF